MYGPDEHDLTALLARLRASARAPIAPIGGQWGALTDYYHGRFTQVWYQKMAAQGRILMRTVFQKGAGDDDARPSDRKYVHHLDDGTTVDAPWYWTVKVFVKLCEDNVKNEQKTFRTYSNVTNIKDSWKALKPMLEKYAVQTTETVVKKAIADMQTEMANYMKHYENMDHTTN